MRQNDGCLSFLSDTSPRRSTDSFVARFRTQNRALDKPTEQVQLQEQGAIEIRWQD